MHGVGGALGSLLTGLFAQPKNGWQYPAGSCPYGSLDSTGMCNDPNGNIVSGAFYDHTLPNGNRHGKQLGLQFYGIVVEAGWAAFTSFILLKIIDKTMGLRVDIRDEVEGLDASVHGETVFYGGDDMVPPEGSQATGTHGKEGTELAAV